MKISVNVPSYKRPNDIKTLQYLPYVRVWVDGSDYDAYKKANPKADIVRCALYEVRVEYSTGQNCVDKQTCYGRACLFGYDFTLSKCKTNEDKDDHSGHLT